VTQNSEKIGVRAQRPMTTDAPVPSRPAGGETRRWYNRPWIVPLVLVVGVYLTYQLQPFIGLDEKTAPMPPHEGFSAYYPVLMAHIVSATIAMLTVIPQVWPWLRVHHPAVHRRIGVVYVVASVVSAVLALIILRYAPPVGQVGVAMATTFWVATTIAGYVTAVRGHYASHRRWMLYSFAIVINNFWGVAIYQVGSRLNVDLTHLLEAARWVGWVVNLMLVQWWLYHTSGRPLQLPARLKRVHQAL
jgi:uncharacterized membrane protein